MRIYTVGWPRSGTKHLGRLLAGALGTKPTFALPKSRGGLTDDDECPTICQCSIMAYHKPYHSPHCFLGPWFVYRNLNGDERIVWIIRDPRDAAVSLWVALRRNRPQISPDYSLASYIEDFFTVQIINGPPASWRRYTESWQRAAEEMPGSIVRVRHETMMANREKELRRILRELGLSGDDECIQRCVGQETGRMRPAYDESGRQVEAGRIEWPCHFDPAAAWLLDDHCGDLMRQFGYGGEPEWFALLERRNDDDHG